MKQDVTHLNESVMAHARREFTVLSEELTVAETLEKVRQQGVHEKIVYFYVVDAQQRLVGIVPTRRLITAALDQRLRDVMSRRVVAIPDTATLLDACELFILHRLLAFPVVDAQRRMLGVVDVSLFTDSVFDLAESELVDEVFEVIGFKVSEVRDASAWRAFRFRFPWLLATLTSGTLCALLAGAFELTLARSLVLAFFITLVLGLAESVSMQSMTVTIHGLRSMRPTMRWYLKALRREAGAAALLGVVCGAVVVPIVWLWRGEALPALVIGLSILLSLGAACVLGLSIPTLLHAFKLDPKISAGPFTLALTDICTLLFYFTLATWLLRG